MAVVAPNPQRPLDEFADEAKMVLVAFQAAWPGRVQVIQREITLQHLYDVADDHAFKFLWEQRLGRSEDELGSLGRKVAGGGLRLVMPATELGSEDPNIEVRVESYLANAQKLFVHLQMQWSRPESMEEFDPAALLLEGERFATTEIVAFIKGGEA